jgi:hypothetical protein
MLVPEAALAALNRPELDQKTYGTLRLKFLQGSGRTTEREKEIFYEVELSRRLRIYVDEWQETARSREGSEAPFERRLSRTSTAKEAHSTYLVQHPPTVASDAEGGLHLRLADVPQGAPSGSEFFTVIEAAALRMFTLMMTSDWKIGICKCRYPRCGKYFFIEKPRSAYKQGTFCRRSEHHAQNRSIQIR